MKGLGWFCLLSLWVLEVGGWSRDYDDVTNNK